MGRPIKEANILMDLLETLKEHQDIYTSYYAGNSLIREMKRIKRDIRRSIQRDEKRHSTME